jgi:hypothetical protein
VIFLVVVMTLGDMDFERREPMPTIEACWVRAAERFAEITRQHPDVVELGVGCTLQTEEPA